MKSYLSLIPISAKVHRRGNRMTILCIVIAVFLVTVVFSLADMATRMEEARMREKHGNWHIRLSDISESDAAEVGQRADVKGVAAYSAFNESAAEEYYLEGCRAALYGADECYVMEMMSGLAEGVYPRNEREIVVSTNVKNILGVKVGDTVTLDTPAGSMEYTVSGIGETDSVYRTQAYLAGIFMNRTAFEELCRRNGMEQPVKYYVQFRESANVRSSIADIKKEYGWTDENVSENKGVLMMTGESSNANIWGFYTTAALVFLLVLAAGVLMISGSIGSNIAQRTQFFGMLRCIGMSRQQIIRFVRLEALNWCRMAIPAGVVSGIVVTWGVCAILRVVTVEYADIPVFGLSAAGIISGVMVGITTVLISAQSPAKRAAKVSPMAAVSGNAGAGQNIRHAANTGCIRVDMALGIHHAVSARKNLVLITGSFALSIIVIFCFTALLDFAHTLLPAMRQWQPDISIDGYANACSIDRETADEIEKLPGVKQVYGNIFISGTPASFDREVGLNTIDVVSYDEYMLRCAEDSVVRGDLSKVYGDSSTAMTIYGRDNPLEVGDRLQIGDEELEIGCALSDGLFKDGVIIICSEETFIRLFHEQNYALLNVQLAKDAPYETINSIRILAGSENIFTDCYESNREDQSTYWLTRVFSYGFLAIVGMITVFHIINSISMSVSARIRQYGAMRAVGMDSGQITGMIAAEVFTYIIFGCVFGCTAGIMLNRFIFMRLITRYFGISWSFPAAEFGVVLALLLGTGVLAVRVPAKRIRDMAVTETINEL